MIRNFNRDVTTLNYVHIKILNHPELILNQVQHMVQHKRSA